MIMVFTVGWGLLILGAVGSFWKGSDLREYYYGGSSKSYKMLGAFMYVLGAVLTSVAIAYWATLRMMGWL